MFELRRSHYVTASWLTNRKPSKRFPTQRLQNMCLSDVWSSAAVEPTAPTTPLLLITSSWTTWTWNGLDSAAERTSRSTTTTWWMQWCTRSRQLCLRRPANSLRLKAITPWCWWWAWIRVCVGGEGEGGSKACGVRQRLWAEYYGIWS